MTFRQAMRLLFKSNQGVPLYALENDFRLCVAVGPRRMSSIIVLARTAIFVGI